MSYKNVDLKLGQQFPNKLNLNLLKDVILKPLKDR